MVLKKKKRFVYDESWQHAYNKRLRRLDCGCQLVSFTELPYSGIPEELPVSDCVDVFDVHCGGGVGASSSAFSIVDKDIRMRTGNFVANVHYRTAVSAAFSDPFAFSSNNVVRRVHNYSPLFEDKLSHPACNFPEIGSLNCEKNPLPEVHLNDSKFGVPPTSGILYKEIERREVNAFFNDYTESVDHRVLDLPLTSCSFNGKAEVELNELSSFSSFFDDDHRLEDFSQVGVPHNASIDYGQRKPVAVGPNHQAEIPSWRPHETASSLGSSNCSKGSSAARDDSSERLLGKCVIPRLDPLLSASEFCFSDRAYCSCENDGGSMKCVRLHVEEARERLKHTLGQGIYKDLGFFDMGEVVSQKWSEEEENLFHEVVLSNPASLGRNFWDHLRQGFPSRGSEELISYYFNVFKLRKRAEQNRVDPFNADSDDDEWQESDGRGEFEEEYDSAVESPGHESDGGAEFEEEYDSAVESPGGAIGTLNDVDQMTDISEGSDDADACEDYTADGANKDDLFYSSAGHKDESGHVEELDIHYESCSSYEAQHHGAESNAAPAGIPEAQYCLEGERKSVDGECKNVGVGVTGRGFDGQCDLKTWDASYIYGLNKVLELSPTCKVIEEVFGKEV